MPQKFVNIDQADLTKDKLLGEGHYGEVFSGYLSLCVLIWGYFYTRNASIHPLHNHRTYRGTPIATKSFNLDLAAEELKEDFPAEETKVRALSSFEYEVHLSTRFCHPNLVRCHGASYDGEAFWAIFDLCQGGTLQGLLQQKPNTGDGSGIGCGKPYVRSEAGVYYKDVGFIDQSVRRCALLTQNIGF